MYGYDDNDIKSLLEGIYRGTITPFDLPKDLYMAIGKYLAKGVYDGYGINFNELRSSLNSGIAGVFTESDLELLTELRENVYIFSAAKTYQNVRLLSNTLVDENGVLQEFGPWFKEASKAFDLYNVTYAKVEHMTAQGQGTIGAYWQRIQATKEDLPYLTYHTIGKACEICAPLNGLTAPVDDRIWWKIMPLNHFGCFCTVDQRDKYAKVTHEDVKNRLYHDAIDKMDDNFKMNAGRDGYVFKPDHPYFTVPKKDTDFARNNFGLAIPDKD